MCNNCNNFNIEEYEKFKQEKSKITRIINKNGTETQIGHSLNEDYGFDINNTNINYFNENIQSKSSKYKVQTEISITQTGTNSYKLTASFWVPDGTHGNPYGEAWNAYGTTLKIKDSNGNTISSSGSFVFGPKSGGSCYHSYSKLTISANVNVSSTQYYHSEVRCNNCNAANRTSDHGNWDEWNCDSSTVTATYTNPQIIPGKPTIAIESPSDGNGRSNYTVYQSNSFGIDGTFRLYPCQSVSEVSASNKLRFTVGKPSNSTNVKIYLSRYVNGSGWNHNYYVTNWNGSSFSFEKEFSSSDRYDKGVAWRVRAEAISSTSNLSESDHIYFIINDLPVFSNNEPNISCPQIVKPSETSCNISWTSAINTAFATTYKLRYKNSAESNWNEVNTSSTSYSLNISGKNYNRGSEVSFGVKALDSYDGDLDFRGSAKMKINTLPFFNENSITSSSDNNQTFTNNITLTIPRITDYDGQSTSFKLEYNNEGSSTWQLIVDNSTNFSVTKQFSEVSSGKYIQFRATPYDGLEYGNSIYSKKLYKNKPVEFKKIYYDCGKKYYPKDEDDRPCTKTSTSILSRIPRASLHMEKLLQVSWDNFYNYSDYSKIPNSNCIITISSSSGSNTYIGKDYGDGSKYGCIDLRTVDNNYIKDISRGSTFSIRLSVTDNMGQTSSYEELFYRNNVPSDPTDFESLYTNSSSDLTHRRIKFNKSTDPDLDNIYYRILVKRDKTNNFVDVDNEKYKYLTSDNNTITFNFVDPNSNYRDFYAIQAVDEHGASSNIISNSGRKPSGVEELSDMIVYNSKPRVIFDLSSTNSEEYVNIEIRILDSNNNLIGTYNSIDNEQYFSMPTYKKGSKGCFRCPTDLKIGRNRIIMQTFVGPNYSDATDFYINYSKSLVPEISEGQQHVSSKMINDMKKMINDLYNTYRCSFNKLSTENIESGSLSTFTIYNNIFNDLYNINDHINNYDKDYRDNDKLVVNLNKDVVIKNMLHLIKQINNMVGMNDKTINGKYAGIITKKL